jgi:ArsR family transcriptional regulator
MHNHDMILAEVRSRMPSGDTLEKLSDLFKIFGDSTRMKILYSLFEEELCVCAIADLLGMTQSAISHQLKVLKDANLVCARREGKTVYYSLADDHVNLIISQGFNHIKEGEHFMKKTYRMEDLDCAHCAAKMEEGISKLEGVRSVAVNFLAQKLMIELDEERQDDIMKQAQRVVKKVDPNCRILLG